MDRYRLMQSDLIIDHLTQNFHYLPQGGTDTGKQNSGAQLTCCVCQSLSHLTGINGTKDGVIYRLQEN